MSKHKLLMAVAGLIFLLLMMNSGVLAQSGKAAGERNNTVYEDDDYEYFDDEVDEKLDSLLGSIFGGLLGEGMSFDSPGDDFIKSEIGNGYEHPTDHATLIGMLFPQEYEKVYADFQENSKTEEEFDVLSAEDVKLGKHNGFLVKALKEAPDDPDYKEYMVLMFICPADANSTVSINATFPKKLKKKYEEKMLEAMGTLVVK